MQILNLRIDIFKSEDDGKYYVKKGLMDSRGYKEFLNSSGYRTVYKQMTTSINLKDVALFICEICGENDIQEFLETFIK